MLLDMAALVAESGAVGTVHLDLFGDDAVAAVLAWASNRGVAVDPS